MTKKPQIELSIKDTKGNEQVAYPYVEADHVTLENGMLIEEVIKQDIMTPNVIHQETNFKVGVGDQDVSNSIVDSTVGKMVIKGQTYQNILPEPSTHILSNNKQTFKVSDGIDENVEFVDGVAKSAILKGQTLVNVWKKHQTYLPNNFIMHDDGFMELNNPVLYFDHIQTDSSLLKPNTKYLLVVEVKNNTLPVPITVYPDTRTVFAGNEHHVLFNSTTNGVAKVILTTISDFSTTKDDLRWGAYISFAQNTVLENERGMVTIRQMLIEYQEGMENWDIPYFEDMTSVKTPVLKTTGKNLWEGNRTLVLEDGTLYLNRHYKKGTYYFSGTVDVEYDNKTVVAFGNSSTKYWAAAVIGNNIPTIVKEDCDQIAFYSCGWSFANSLNKPQTITNLMISSTYTSYEPFKSNILTCNEEVTLRGIGDIKDELNLLTGECVQRIGEITFDGSEGWAKHSISSDDYFVGVIWDVISNAKDGSNLISNKLKGIQSTREDSAMYIVSQYPIITFHKSSLDSMTIESFKKKLSELNPTIQYPLATESVKTVDLSSSGNWEKVVLDGSENWTTGDDNLSSVYRNYVFLPNNIHGVNLPCFVNDSNFPNIVYGENKQGVVYGAGNGAFYVFSDKKKYPTLESFKKYLSQNPMTVWYQIETHQDSTQVKQPIFFKDGHIQLSSGVDNSLIPTLDYQAKTSNSYVMDLMKANTVYTMKCSNPLGGYTIDGIAYNFVSNRTFNSPSTFTNKLLVATGSATDLMIIEGDVTSKTIPYFKGIKSAFEGESKLEVLSTGKNLLDIDYLVKTANNPSKIYKDENGDLVISGDSDYIPFSVPFNVVFSFDQVTKGSNTSASIMEVKYDDGRSLHLASGSTEGEKANSYKTNSSRPITHFRFNNWCGGTTILKNFVCVSLDSTTSYEPYKSNSTKIPLLSPLRSLPNGVCDEVVVDRKNSKATLIQRIGNITFDGSSDETWHTWGINNSVSHLNSYHYVDGTNNTKKLGVKTNPSYTTTQLAVGGGYSSTQTGVGLNGSYFSFSIPKNYVGVGTSDTTSMCENKARQWLSQNPIILYYELATPVISEVDLDNFPYIYKDGHIFLNSEIAPTTEVAYSICQQHQIEASNEDLMRHEKEISYLYKLIAQYVQVDYQSTLLALNLELN